MPTKAEELANSITHGLGAALSIAALTLLTILAATRGTALQITACAIYGSTLVLLYTSSTLYHALTHPAAKRLFHILDHASIYLLIAGTYTPFTLIALHGAWRWTLFSLIWTLAAAGVTLKCFFIGRAPSLSTALYLAMGWLALLAIVPLFRALSTPAFALLLAGGALYSLGVLFFLARHKYAHAVWHLFVLAASAAHFAAVYLSLPPLAR